MVEKIKLMSKEPPIKIAGYETYNQLSPTTFNAFQDSPTLKVQDLLAVKAEIKARELRISILENVDTTNPKGIIQSAQLVQL